MKKTIRGVKYKTFAPHKNATELGIDLKRKFIVIDDDFDHFKVGEILTIKEDDNSIYPYFYNEDETEYYCMYWRKLAYYDEAPASKTKFKVGDKVRKVYISAGRSNVPIGTIGIIKKIISQGYYEIDYVGFAPGNGTGEDEWLDLVKPETPKELIISCTTKQQWKDVCEKLEREYPELRWAGDDGNKMFVKDGWRESERYIASISSYWKRHIASISSYWNGGYHSAPRSYFEREYPQIPITTAQEYLGSAIYGTAFHHHYVDYGEAVEKYGKYNLNNKPKKKFMSKVINAIKDTRLSKEDKLLRKYDMVDDNINWTREGREAIYELEAQERGYSTMEKMCKKLEYDEDNDPCPSTFELDDLITKHLPALLEQLQKLEKEDKTK